MKDEKIIRVAPDGDHAGNHQGILKKIQIIYFDQYKRFFEIDGEYIECSSSLTFLTNIPYDHLRPN